MKKVLLSIVVLVLMTKLSVYADEFPLPEPFEIKSKDNNKLLKFIPSSEENNYESAIVEVYDQGKLWYTIEGLNSMGSSKNEFVISDDFQYLVRIPLVDQEKGLCFYKEGILIKEVPIIDLIKYPSNVEYTVSMAQWENKDQREFGPNTNILQIETVEKTIFDYDITTGELAKQPTKYSNVLIPIVVGGTIIVILATLIRKKNRNNSLGK